MRTALAVREKACKTLSYKFYRPILNIAPGLISPSNRNRILARWAVRNFNCDRNSRVLFGYRRRGFLCIVVVYRRESRRGVWLSDGRSVIQGRLCIVRQILVVLLPETFWPPPPHPSLQASSRGSGRMRACSQATPSNTRTNGVSPGGAQCDGIEWNSTSIFPRVWIRSIRNFLLFARLDSLWQIYLWNWFYIFFKYWTKDY